MAKTLTFKTETGSLYEVDHEAKRVRRLIGLTEPTKRTGADGAWKNIVAITDIVVGANVLIVWPETEEAVQMPCSQPGTITSRVAEVFETEALN